VTRRAAVLGLPIAHSLSPVLHRAAYAALEIDWTYEAIECDESALPSVLAERADWAGFSCTMPLKRAVLDVADEVSTIAAAVGAANTLLPRTGGGWAAENTDVAGLAATVRESEVSLSSVTVLGAGGTAQAAMAALRLLDVSECVVLVRDRARTGELRAAAETLGIRVELADLDVRSAALSADLVVSTLPPHAADPFAGVAWRSTQTVLDVVYDPWPTELAGSAAAAGARVLSGAVLLLHQAAAQVELMTGRPAPVDAMRTALRLVRPGSDL
jgi:shikimate dehydrogenase